MKIRGHVHGGFGVVKEIVAQGRCDDGYRGQGWFRFERHPTDIFRDANKGVRCSTVFLRLFYDCLATNLVQFWYNSGSILVQFWFNLTHRIPDEDYREKGERQS